MSDSFATRDHLTVNGQTYTIFSLEKLGQRYDISKLPYSMKILLENLLRCEDGVSVTKASIEAVAQWDAKQEPDTEIAFMPARVVLQDFTGVPCVVDLAAMRDAVVKLGGSASNINPLIPSELVIDHSVQVDFSGRFADARERNLEIEYERNIERYEFLKWGQLNLNNFRAVPPGRGIVHQVNLEWIAKVAHYDSEDGKALYYPDSVVGTDSHTTMINGAGVLGWGVGGIEAEAVMLGQPVYMLTPEVIGFKLIGKLKPGVTATDMTLRIVQMLRKRGVVEKFVEFFGPGMGQMPVADRAMIANMAPEYGATCGIFPVDQLTLDFLRQTGRDEDHVKNVEAFFKAQGLFHDASTPDAEYTDVLELDLSTVEPALAGPKRPQDRINLSDMKKSWDASLTAPVGHSGHGLKAEELDKKVAVEGTDYTITHGDVVIAAITSCTNTSNPSVMIAAGLVARKANALGIKIKPWVKPSLAPGSRVVTEYYAAAGLDTELNQAGFSVVGYGCTTCIGNSGPIDDNIGNAIDSGNLVAASVLSGNRNFEGRVHSKVKANFLASPPLVVAYALAGTVNIDMATQPLGHNAEGKPVFLADVWPSDEEVQSVVKASITPELFRSKYADVTNEPRWDAIEAIQGDNFIWKDESTYVRNPPFFQNMDKEPGDIQPIEGARVLLKLGDSITTDHISPAGEFKASTPAGRYLVSKGVEPADFNSYGSRRGNHEVMMRGTFANVRIRNQVAPGTEGGVTTCFLDNKVEAVYDASMKYQDAGVPLVVLAGEQYGTGSSRDWAAKGTFLLGVKAVITKSFERIHRSNLVGMGVLPLCYKNGQDAESLGLDGTEVFTIVGLNNDVKPGQDMDVIAKKSDGTEVRFTTQMRLDTPVEVNYYRNGGILQTVLRKMALA